MCAITGLISKRSIDQELFKTMNNLARHRGPDGEGYFFVNGVALGHRRLAILDLSDAGEQPMERSGLQITFNGEIYNYKELRIELEKVGHKFHSDTDTEILLASYQEWGKDCVKRFNGMWAFAIYDPRTKELFCSRDRFGIKPFYYFKSDNVFVFGSEIKQILTFPEVKRKVNPRAVSKYLISSIVDDTDETFFEGIFKLTPGHNLSIHIETLRLEFQSIMSWINLTLITNRKI